MVLETEGALLWDDVVGEVRGREKCVEVLDMGMGELTNLVGERSC